MGVTRLKIKKWEGLDPPGDLEENQFPCLVQLLEAAYIPWLVPPHCVHLQSPEHSISLTLLLSFSDHSRGRVYIFKDLCD